jgi:hypothetical protein
MVAVGSRLASGSWQKRATIEEETSWATVRAGRKVQARRSRTTDQSGRVWVASKRRTRDLCAGCVLLLHHQRAHAAAVRHQPYGGMRLVSSPAAANRHLHKRREGDLARSPPKFKCQELRPRRKGVANRSGYSCNVKIPIMNILTVLALIPSSPVFVLPLPS